MVGSSEVHLTKEQFGDTWHFTQCILQAAPPKQLWSAAQTPVKASVHWSHVYLQWTAEPLIKRNASSCGRCLPAGVSSSPWEATCPPGHTRSDTRSGGTLGWEDHGSKIRRPCMWKSEQEKLVRYFNSFCWYKIPVLCLKDIRIHNKTSFFNRHFCCTWVSCAFSFNFN